MACPTTCVLGLRLSWPLCNRPRGYAGGVHIIAHGSLVMRVEGGQWFGVEWCGDWHRYGDRSIGGWAQHVAGANRITDVDSCHPPKSLSPSFFPPPFLLLMIAPPS